MFPLGGTKLSCNQGGCGACTCTMTTVNTATGAAEYKAFNACLRPLLAMDGMAVTTTEGIGNRDDGYHAVQERIADCNGSQCGFCTPGQVMTLYSLLRERPGGDLGLEEIEERFDGNICRCTGYRPIMTAAHTFAKEGCRDLTDIQGLPATAFAAYSPASEPPPPAELAKMAWTRAAMKVSSPVDGTTWYRVVTIDELLKIRAQEPETKLVAGNTMTGPYGKDIRRRDCHSAAPPSTFSRCINSDEERTSAERQSHQWLGKDDDTKVFIDISSIPELSGVQAANAAVTVGAATTITALIQYLEANASKSASFKTLVRHMKRVGNWQVRNVGSWAGNLVTVSGRRDCYCTDTPLFILIETPTEGTGGCHK